MFESFENYIIFCCCFGVFESFFGVDFCLKLSFLLRNCSLRNILAGNVQGCLNKRFLLAEKLFLF